MLRKRAPREGRSMNLCNRGRRLKYGILVIVTCILLTMYVYLTSETKTQTRPKIKPTVSNGTVDVPTYSEPGDLNPKPLRKPPSEIVASNANENSEKSNVKPVRRRAERHAGLDELPADDETTLANLTNFEYVLDSRPCDEGERAPTLLIAVHSAPLHRSHRDAVRETWGRPAEGARLIFMLGAVDSRDLQRELEREHAAHGDIVQGNFVDSYRNMTLKHIMSLKWALYNCAGAAFALKVDDDTYANVPRVLEYARALAGEAAAAISCRVYVGNPALRRPGSKWDVSYEEWPCDAYPPHCSGYAILYPVRDVAFKLYAAAQRVPYLWVDDAYVSGVLARRANVTHRDWGGGGSVTERALRELIANGTRYEPRAVGAEPPTRFEHGFMFGPINMRPELVRELWEWVTAGA